MAALKPAYLIHGDDHGAIAERRAGLRAYAERQQGGSASVELLDGDGASPAGAAQALAAMTLAVGWRVIIVEGVERWRQADVEAQLIPAATQIAPDTTLALIAREEARAKAPAAAHDLVKRAGGQVLAHATVKSWELPKWARQQAERLGLSLDSAAAKALIAQVGERQQRLLRELEKLSLEAPGGEAGDGEDSSGRPSPLRSVSAQEIELRTAHSSEWRAYGLADALVAADARAATLAYVRLRQQGERLSGLGYLMAQRLRDALAASLRLHDGQSAAEVKRALRMPPRAAERFLADVARSDPQRLRAALAALAELELDSRGGAPLASSRSAGAGLHEDTLALRAIGTITSA